MSRPLADVELDGLTTRRGPSPDLDDVSLHVRYGELFTILGPPHSGKTSVLRAIAGFLPLHRGRVIVDGRDVTGVAPGRRGIAFVLQEGALWPHLAVRAHVTLALAEQGMKSPDLDRKTETVLARLGLTEVVDARPPALTLDHRRRLALARALAPEPRVLLLDEPLAHLDPVHRKTLRIELAKLHADLAVTTICATRDAADALALSDRIGVLLDGRLVQVGEPEQVYRHPVNRAVAEALGPASFLPVHVVEVRDLGVVVETERGDRVPVPGVGHFTEGSHGSLVLRPETVAITEASEARGPGIPGRVSARLFEGARHVYEVDVGASVPVMVEVPATGETRLYRVGERVRVETNSESVVLIR